jgi:hypothetical protein
VRGTKILDEITPLIASRMVVHEEFSIWDYECGLNGGVQRFLKIYLDTVLLRFSTTRKARKQKDSEYAKN